MSETTFLQFECDGEGCDAEHCVEVQHDSEPDDKWPLGWVLIRTRGIGLSTDIEQVLCCKCREPLLKAMGFSSYESYMAMVKATAEMEQQLAQERLVASRSTTSIITSVETDPSNLN